MKTYRTATQRHARTFGAIAAAGALLAVPAIGQAAKPDRAGKGHAKSAKSCAKAHDASFSVRGTFVSGTPDNPATPANDPTVTMKVTSANRHAKRSGEIADQDAAKRGVQVRGATLTVPVAAGDAFVLKLDGYEGTDTPSVDDKVKVKARVAVTKKRCAADGTSIADRYGAVDVSKVTIADRDADA